MKTSILKYKEKIALLGFAMFMKFNCFASGMFGSSVEDMMEELETVFPWVVGIMFLVLAGMNHKHFMGEDRDLKKGFTNIIVFVIGVSVTIAVYQYLKGLSL